MPAKTDNA